MTRHVKVGVLPFGVVEQTNRADLYEYEEPPSLAVAVHRAAILTQDITALMEQLRAVNRFADAERQQWAVTARRVLAQHQRTVSRYKEWIAAKRREQQFSALGLQPDAPSDELLRLAYLLIRELHRDYAIPWEPDADVLLKVIAERIGLRGNSIGRHELAQMA